MKTKKLAWLLLLCSGYLLTACAPADVPLPSQPGATAANLPISTPTAQVTPFLATQETPVLTPAPAETNPPFDPNLLATILISVNGSSFSAKLYDNETARALLAQLPLDVTMSELNGVEKYYNLPENLPSPSTEKPATIHAGEIMLWSSNTLVLFYNTFSNSYGGYVKLGYVEDITGLAAALGGGSVQVTFTASK